MYAIQHLNTTALPICSVRSIPEKRFLTTKLRSSDFFNTEIG